MRRGGKRVLGLCLKGEGVCVCVSIWKADFHAEWSPQFQKGRLAAHCLWGPFRD